MRRASWDIFVSYREVNILRLGGFVHEFGGEEVAYAGAWELVLLSTGSRLLDLERKARRGVRGLKRNIS